MQDEAPDADTALVSHAVQVALLVAPVAFEYVPASHAVQVASLVAPVTFEYVPASHAVQPLLSSG